jgi:hypothetical protein
MTIMRRCPCGILAHLCPDVLDRVQLRSRNRQQVDRQPRLTGQKILNHLTMVIGMTVPHQDHRTGHQSQHLLQESDDIFAGQAMPVGFDTQADPFSVRSHQQRPEEIQADMVVNASAHDGRLTASRPGALDGRDQREAAFIFKHQGSAQVKPLFLSLAGPRSSTVQSPPRPDANPDVAGAGSSSPYGLRRATLRSAGSAPQITAKSPAQCDPGSSAPRHTQRHTPLDPMLSLAVSPAWGSTSLGGHAGERLSGSDASGQFAASGSPSDELRPTTRLHPKPFPLFE